MINFLLSFSKSFSSLNIVWSDARTVSSSDINVDTNISGDYDPSGQFWGSGITPAINLQDGTKNNEWRYLIRSGDHNAGGVGDLSNSMPTGINYIKPSDIDVHLANPNIGGIKMRRESGLTL